MKRKGFSFSTYRHSLLKKEKYGKLASKFMKRGKFYPRKEFMSIHTSQRRRTL
jgi:hypothetical protein